MQIDFSKDDFVCLNVTELIDDFRLFLVIYFDFLYGVSCHKQTLTVLFSSLKFVFYLFFSMTAVWTSNTMMNKRWEQTSLLKVSEFRETAFSFSPLSMMLAVILSYIYGLLLCEVCSLSVFFCIYWGVHMI